MMFNVLGVDGGGSVSSIIVRPLAVARTIEIWLLPPPHADRPIRPAHAAASIAANRNLFIEPPEKPCSNLLPRTVSLAAGACTAGPGSLPRSFPRCQSGRVLSRRSRRIERIELNNKTARESQSTSPSAAKSTPTPHGILTEWA